MPHEEIVAVCPTEAGSATKTAPSTLCLGYATGLCHAISRAATVLCYATSFGRSSTPEGKPEGSSCLAHGGKPVAVSAATYAVYGCLRRLTETEASPTQVCELMGLPRPSRVPSRISLQAPTGVGFIGYDGREEQAGQKTGGSATSEAARQGRIPFICRTCRGSGKKSRLA